MRVLFFSDNSSDHNHRFLQKLSASAAEVWFLDLSRNAALENWLPAGVRWVAHEQSYARGSEPSTLASFVPEFRRLLQQVQPDVVHAGPVQSAAYVAALAQFHPLLVASWGSDLLLQANRNDAWRGATAVALRAADALFCDCNAVRRAAAQFADFPQTRIVQFPWGVERGSFSPDGALPPAGDLHLSQGAIPLISTRSWEPLYQIPTLLESFAMARQQEPRLHLLLLGDGSQTAEIRRFIEHHGLQGAVSIPGRVFRPDLPKWFRAAQAYVSCAGSDGTSISLLEAMATGLPAIVTDIASNREWVTEGQNGWLAAADSVEDFAGKILRAVRLSAPQRAAMARLNRTTIEERADWDRNFPMLTLMYKQLANHTSR